MQDASRIDQNAPGRIAHCDDAYIGKTPMSLRWLSRLTGVIAACAWACPSASGQQAGETIVRLYPTAVVAADQVTLADIAEVSGESAELVARMDLGGAPHAGQSGSVDSAHVQAMLSRRGVNLSKWIFRGASRCVVRRVGRTAAPTQTKAHDNVPSSAVNATQKSSNDGAKHETPAADPQTLEAVLRTYLSSRLTETGGTPIIHFSPASSRFMPLSKPNYDFRISNRSDRLLGMVALEVTIVEGGEVKQTVPVLADVSLHKSVIVTTRPVNRGEIIKPDQLILEDRTFDRVEDIGIVDTASLIGQRTKRFLENHSILYAKDIEPMPLILTNELVTVTAKRGGMTVRGSAKALGQGGLGESVRLRNEMSKDIFSAIVTGLRTAEVRDPVTAKTAPLADASMHLNDNLLEASR